MIPNSLLCIGGPFDGRRTIHCERFKTDRGDYLRHDFFSSALGDGAMAVASFLAPESGGEDGAVESLLSDHRIEWHPWW